MPKFILLSLTFISLLFGQSYIWPTNASRQLTSNFAEPRVDRFHAGIDISTWNREGYPCYAIADGYAYRIWTQTRGYGKAIYVKLNDGRIAVYAHLQRYRPDIENYMKRLQRRAGKYNQNKYLSPGQFPVKRGDIVGYTGRTGIGSPHLHFEIRSNLNTNIQPLQFYPEFKDRSFPTVRSVMISPLTHASSVNGSLFPQEVTPMRVNDSTYTIDKPIRFSGQIGFTVAASDASYRRGIRIGLRGVALMIGDSLVFQSDYPQTTYTDNHWINLDIDLFKRKILAQKWRRVYAHPKHGLRKWMRHRNFGRIGSEIGRVKPFRLILIDAGQNRTTVHGQLQFEFVQLHRPFDQDRIQIPDRLASLPILRGPRVFHDGRLNQWPSSRLLNDSVYRGVLVAPSQGATVESTGFTYSVPSQSVLDSTVLLALTIPSERYPVDVDYQSDVSLLQPVDLFLDKRMTVRLNRALKKGEGIYEWNPRRRRWDFVRSRLSSSRRPEFVARSVNEFVVIRDTIPPVVRLYKTKSSDTQLHLFLKDDFSGIRDEANFTIRMGEQTIVGEYDDEAHVLKIDRADLRSGMNLAITVRDNVGNLTIRRFRIP